MRAYVAPIIVSIVCSLAILWPLMGSGMWYPMHDSTHPVRVMLLTETLRGGQIPPIWAEGINGGFGYPLFHFYAPLFHLCTSLLVLIGIPVYTALKIMLNVAVSVGVSGVMVFSKRWGRVAAIVSGILFVLAPFVALDIYVRGAYAELLSIALIPWVLVATEKINTTKRLAASALMLALFVLSHNVMPILFIPLVTVWIMVLNWKRPLYALAAVIIGIGLSAWFTVPVLFERGFTKADEIAKTTQYSLHFVEPWQLWNSTWGFGGSVIGVEDGMSFKLGKIHLVLGALGIAVAVFQKKYKLFLFGLFLAVSFFLATPFSKSVWDAIEPLQIVQFPWRSLGIMTVLLSILGGFAVSRIPYTYVRWASAGVIIALTAMLGYKYFKPETAIAPSYDRRDIASVVPEYEPRWFQKEGERPELFDQDKGISTVPRAYYPTWVVKVDGETVRSFPSGTGLLSFDNPGNSDDIELLQEHTQLEKIALAVSLASLLVVFILWKGRYAKA